MHSMRTLAINTPNGWATTNKVKTKTNDTIMLYDGPFRNGGWGLLELVLDFRIDNCQSSHSLISDLIAKHAVHNIQRYNIDPFLSGQVQGSNFRL